MSFWSASDKIPVRQTKVSIAAENGLDYTAGQTINFMIPPTVEFIQPKETYLRFDCQVDMGTMPPTRLQLDKMGGSVVIRDIRVYSGGAGGTLLEEIQGYNCLTSVRYSYDQNESIRNQRSLVEGAAQYNPKTRGTLGGPQCETNNVTENPNFTAYTDVEDVLQNTAHSQKKVKCLLPIHTGIFQNDKVFPCLLTDGLRIEILLENAPRCIVPISTCNEAEPLANKVLFHSLNGIDTAQNAGPQAWDSGAANGQTIFVRRDNQQTTGENFPFAIGEQVALVDITQNQTQLTQTGTNASAALCGADVFMTIESIKHYAAQSDATAVGGFWGLTEINFTADVTRVAAGLNNRVIGGNSAAKAVWGLVSRAFNVATSAQKDSINYKLSDVELIVQQVEMPQGYTSKLMSMMKEGGSLNYDFLSYRNYRHSSLAGDTQVNMRLPLVESRAKAIICVPTDSSVYTTATQITGAPHTAIATDVEWAAWSTAEAAKYGYNYNCSRVFSDGTDATGGVAADQFVPWFSSRSGLEGVWDNLTAYQMFYDGKLNPSRRVECSGVSSGRSLSQQWAIETEKALAMSNIAPHSFRDLHKNAVIGRALSLQDGVYDTRNKDFNLQLSYEGTADTVAPVTDNRARTKNILWNAYVSHIRRLVVRGNAISIEV